MSFIQILRILWARKSIILIATLGCFLTAVAIAKLLPPRYEANSRVMLDIIQPDPVTGQVIAGSWARAFVKTQIELIKDYSVAGEVADKAGWMSSPELAAEYNASPASANMDFRRWLAQKIIDNTQADLLEGSNILEIKFSSTSPQPAARLADLLRDAYVEQTLELRREGAQRNAAWFAKQSESLREQLAAAEANKTKFERENGVVLNEQNVDADTAKLAALAAATPVAQSVIAMPSAAPQSDLTPSSSQLTQMDAAISLAMQNLGPQHPELIRMRETRAAIAKQVAAEKVAIRANSRTAAAPQGPNVGALYAKQQAKVLANAGKVGEAKRLATDVAVLREQFQKTSARAAELQQEAESEETSLKLLGNAVVPQTPAFPKIPLIIVGSLGLGLAFGVLVALTTEFLSRKVRGIEDLEMADVPFIGAMATETQGWKFPGFQALQNRFAKQAPA